MAEFALPLVGREDEQSDAFTVLGDVPGDLPYLGHLLIGIIGTGRQRGGWPAAVGVS